MHPDTTTPLVCTHCGVTLPYRPPGRRQFKQPYCSHECFKAAHRPSSLWELCSTRIEPLPSGCWRWTGCISRAGYGRVRVGGTKGKLWQAHRAVYEHYRGPVADGLELDHLCRNRWCVNPDHVEPVSHVINVRRGESRTMVIQRSGTCIRGHDRSTETSYSRKGWVSRCRACRRELRRKATR
jgi:hypothetical protein